MLMLLLIFQISVLSIGIFVSQTSIGHFKEAIEDFEKALKHQKDFESAKMGLEASRQALKALV